MMQLRDKETQFLIKITEGLYKKTGLNEVNIKDIDVDRFIKLALKNNILYYCSKEIIKDPSLDKGLRQRFENIIKKADIELCQISKSIDEIKAGIKGYVIFKTYRGENFPRIGNDVDVLVNSEELGPIKNYFLARGYKSENDDPKEKSVGLLKKGQKKIHLQGGITWCWQEFLDEELIYGEPRKVVYNGQEITIPNKEADLLIHIAHMNFEPLLMIYSEMLYLFKLLPSVDLDLALKQAKKYRWKNTFLRTINIINNFHCLLYDDVCVNNIEFKKASFSEIKFPYGFSFKHLFLMCLEKRMFIYPLIKIFKIMNLLKTKDAYQYIDPPERYAVSGPGVGQ